MRVANVVLPGGERSLCRLDDDRAVPLLPHGDAGGYDPLRFLLDRDSNVSRLEPTGESVALEECRLLSPITAPSKILAIGLNYAPHASETALDLPESPLLFAKYPSSIIGPGEAIRYDSADTQQVDYEAELAVVIGKPGRHISADAALGHVFGYTVCNDVSARDIQFADKQWVRGKSLDTFCPLGPWIVTTDEIADPQALEVSCRIGSTVLQKASTAEMIFPVRDLICFLSRTMTLQPGDVIATGTPAGVGFTREPPVFLRDGDVVEVEVEGIGCLSNPVEVTHR